LVGLWLASFCGSYTAIGLYRDYLEEYVSSPKYLPWQHRYREAMEDGEIFTDMSQEEFRRKELKHPYFWVEGNGKKDE
jgi:hypothetical protein